MCLGTQIFKSALLLPEILKRYLYKAWAAWDHLDLWSSSFHMLSSWEAIHSFAFWHSDFSKVNREVKVTRVPKEFSTKLHHDARGPFSLLHQKWLVLPRNKKKVGWRMGRELWVKSVPPNLSFFSKVTGYHLLKTETCGLSQTLSFPSLYPISDAYSIFLCKFN